MTARPDVYVASGGQSVEAGQTWHSILDGSQRVILEVARTPEGRCFLRWGRKDTTKKGTRCWAEQFDDWMRAHSAVRGGRFPQEQSEPQVELRVPLRHVRDLIEAVRARGMADLVRDLEEQFADYDVPSKNERRQRYIRAAAHRYGDDDTEVDASARLSASDDGAFVSAWVWVPASEVGE